MTATEIINQIKPLGREGYKRVLMNHGIVEPVFGVKIEDLKKIQKVVKTDYQLSLDLYDTGIYDCMYLAGLIADDAQMTKKDLQTWVDHPNGFMTCEFTVPWCAAGSRFGRELALRWIDSKKAIAAAAGWATLSGIVALKDDAELDIAELKQLLERVGKTIHAQPDRVRYTMNGFVIAVGCYVKSLTATALQVAKKVGKVSVDMGNTDCKVPDAAERIQKVKQRGTIGKKRKTIKC